jgi:hypothetical protein
MMASCSRQIVLRTYVTLRFRLVYCTNRRDADSMAIFATHVTHAVTPSRLPVLSEMLTN